MITNYVITKKFRFRNFSPLLTILILLIGAYFYSTYKYGGESGIFFLIFFLVFFLIQAFMHLLLHLNYYYANKFDSLECDFENKTIIYHHGNDNTIECKSDEIKIVKHFMSYPARNKKAGLLTWDSYSYCDIELRDERHFIITSLLVPDLEAFLSNMNIDRYRIKKIAGFYSLV